MSALTVSAGRNLQIVAWSVLWAALAAFFVVTIGGPLWVQRYVRTAMVDGEATVQGKSGSVKLAAGDDVRVLAPEEAPRTITEGWSVETLEGGQAFLDFSIHKAGNDQFGPTVNLGPGVRLDVSEIQAPRFRWGVPSRRVALFAAPTLDLDGDMSIGTPWGSIAVTVDTPWGRVDLAPESRARIEFRRRATGSTRASNSLVAARKLRVLAVEGVVTVTNTSGLVVLPPNTRTEVLPDQAPQAPMTGPENLVAGGTFRMPPEEGGWEFGELRTSAVLGRASHEILRGGRSIVAFRREDSAGTPADLFYRQDLGVDVRPGAAISVTAELRVLSQSVPGGGVAGTEYPLFIRLRTEDARGEQCEWPVGFYAVAPEPESGYRTDNGVAVPRGEWYAFASGNLLDPDNAFGFSRRTPPCAPPVRLLRVEIRASGHDFESEIDGVGIWIDPT